MTVGERPPRGAIAQTATRLKRHLKQFAPGARIGPERSLARDLGCSRDTLRSALDVLEREGLIWRHVGQGTFLGPRPVTEAIKPIVLFDQASPADLMDARLVVEPAVVAAAAASATEHDIARMKAFALETRNAGDWRAYEVADDAFHKAIAAATGSRLLMAILSLLSSVRGRSRWQRQHDRAFRAAREREYSLRHGDLHLDIVEAIASHDGAKASEIMREHLLLIRQLMTSEAVEAASAPEQA